MSSQAEETVLGCVLVKNQVWREAAEHVTAADFADPRLGAIFDGMGSAIATGEKLDAVSLELHFRDWGVTGITPDQPWRWMDLGAYPGQVTAAAKVVREEGVRRRSRLILTEGLSKLGEAGFDPQAVVEDVKAGLTETRRARLEVKSLGDILAIPEEEPDWVIPGLLERQDRIIVTGHEGLGKTTLVRQMIIAPAAGVHPLTFEQIPPIRCLVIDAENTERQWKRAASWLAEKSKREGSRDPRPHVMISTSGRRDLTRPDDLGAVHQMIDEHKPDLVFLGPLYRLAVKMNSDDDVTPVIAAIDSIRDRGVAIIIEAHAGHAIGANGIRDVRPRGSSALLGWPEFGFGIRKDTSDGATPEMFEFVAWRGPREQRDWPQKLQRGAAGHWPWIPIQDWQMQ